MMEVFSEVPGGAGLCFAGGPVAGERMGVAGFLLEWRSSSTCDFCDLLESQKLEFTGVRRCLGARLLTCTAVNEAAGSEA